MLGLPSQVWVCVGGSQIEDLAPLHGLAGLTVAGRVARERPDVASERDVRADGTQDWPWPAPRAGDLRRGRERMCALSALGRPGWSAGKQVDPAATD